MEPTTESPAAGGGRATASADTRPASVLRVCATLLLVVGCGDEPAPPAPIYPGDFEDTFEEVRDCRLSPAEHDGFYVRVFADPDAAQDYLDEVAPLAEGTLLVKGEYDDDQCATLARVSAMLKLDAGEAPDLGDWRWQRTDAEGNVVDTPERSCAGCHEACESRDYACTEP